MLEKDIGLSRAQESIYESIYTYEISNDLKKALPILASHCNKSMQCVVNRLTYDYGGNCSNCPITYSYCKDSLLHLFK